MKTSTQIMLRLCVILGCITFGLSSVTAQITYVYTYIAVTPNGQTKFVAVDPHSASSAGKQQDMQVPAGWLPPAYPASVSPDGKWTLLAFEANDLRSLWVRLINVGSGETRDILQGFLASRPTGFGGSLQNVAWSPDGQYVALNMSQTASGADLEVFIYSLGDYKLTNLTNDDKEQFHIAWSSDSSHIVTLSEDCRSQTEPSTCRSRTLDTFSLSTQTPETSLDLVKSGFGPATQGAIACELEWSPSGRLVAFVSGCDDFVTEVPKEVYLWDIKQGGITPVTHFTTDLQKNGAVFLRGTYHLAWLDANNLLIGAHYQGIPDVTNAQSVTYSVGTGAVTTLSQETVEEWAINPISKEIATRSVPPISIITGEEKITGTIGISAYNIAPTGTLSNLSAGTQSVLGCNLSWTPDGGILAYTTTPSGRCDDLTQAIIFVDATTKTSQQHTPAFEQGTTIIPIGWMVAP